MGNEITSPSGTRKFWVDEGVWESKPWQFFSFNVIQWSKQQQGAKVGAPPAKALAGATMTGCSVFVTRSTFPSSRPLSLDPKA
jgi:hypothetical protein